MRCFILVCVLLTILSGPAWGLVCGDGILDPAEQCDDGNLVNGDGCSSVCLFEGCAVTGTWTATVPAADYALSVREEGGGTLVGVAHPVGSPGLLLSVTGQRGGPQLQLGIGSLEFSGAMSDCDTADLIGLAGLTPVALARVRSTFCGDGTVDVGFETCDDGNFQNGDGCSAACTTGATCGDGILDAGEGCDDANGGNHDGCLNGCVPAACGDGYLRAGVEPCDDGNTSAGDGCAPDCSLEGETAGGPVGGAVLSVTTDAESGGDGATPADPIETTLSVPAATTSGTLSIAEQAPPPSNAGWTFFGGLAVLQATDVVPAPSAASPLVVTFRLDATQVPAGQTETTIGVRKDSVAPPNLPACAGPAGQAVPDPCVATRERLGDGDVRITVRTSTLSTWNFGAKTCGDRPEVGCWSADPRKAKLKIRQTAQRDTLAWIWKDELLTPTSPYGDPTDRTDYVLCAYNTAGRLFQFASPAGGMCGDKPCWVKTPSGYKYRDPDGTPDGVVKLGLRASSHVPRAKITNRAAAAALALPNMPLTLPVHVQLRSKDGPCFEATFSYPAVNDASIFRAVGD
jgi:cysteine-rich repeat protein